MLELIDHKVLIADYAFDQIPNRDDSNQLTVIDNGKMAHSLIRHNRITADSIAPGSSDAATIRTFSAAGHYHRRLMAGCRLSTMCGLMHRSKWNPYSTWSARPSSVAGYRSRVPWRAATDVGRRANNAVSHGRCLTSALVRENPKLRRHES
jgi:hypothetical protein